MSDTKYYGVYRGTVFSNKDPLTKRRLRIVVPVVTGDAPTAWAWPLETASVKVASPAVGQGVWVMFENGDPAYPVWVGTFGKEVSKQLPALINRFKSTDIIPQITDLLSVVKHSDQTKEVDVTKTLLNIVSNRYHGSFLYKGNQLAVDANTAYNVPFDTTELSWGVSIVSGDKIRISNPGIYNIAFSLQFSSSNSSEHVLNVWLRKNGANVADSNGRIFLKSHAIAAWNYFVEVDSNGDEFEIDWSASSGGVITLSTLAASAPAPATPAAILTVNKVK